jgi:hypothetical protein
MERLRRAKTGHGNILRKPAGWCALAAEARKTAQEISSDCAGWSTTSPSAHHLIPVSSRRNVAVDRGSRSGLRANLDGVGAEADHGRDTRGTRWAEGQSG